MKSHLIAFGTLILVLFSCTKNDCSNSEKATLVDASGIGGCGIIIKLKSGETVEPKNLNDFMDTPRDGDKVWVSYHLAKSGGTVCMMGDVVIIDCIAKR